MRLRLMFTLALLGGSAMLTACGGESQRADKAGSVAEATKRLPEVAIDNSTPDRALKTLWALQDREMARHCAIFDAMSRDGSEAGKQLYETFFGRGQKAGLVAGNVEKTLAAPASCKDGAYRFQREINEIKTETETRAVALITVKNVTPIPEGASEPDYAKGEREKGHQYRLVFTKIDNGWRVEDAYSRSDALDRWYSMYENPGPDYPYLTSPF